jgi:formylmethanofuran dehydrogenase subunit C
MLGNKKIDIICIISIVIAAVVAVLFINGKKLGIKAEVDEDAENYEGTEYFTANDLNGSVNTESAVLITLNKDDAKIKGNGAYVLDGDVVITGGGKYLISGELEGGSIIVDADSSSKVWLVLQGVNIDGGDDAAIRV